MQKYPHTRRPTTPGEMLREEFLVPLRMSPNAFDTKAGLVRGTTQGLIDGDIWVTPVLADKIAKALGTTSVFWIGLQNTLDKFDASPGFF